MLHMHIAPASRTSTAFLWVNLKPKLARHQNDAKLRSQNVPEITDQKTVLFSEVRLLSFRTVQVLFVSWQWYLSWLKCLQSQSKQSISKQGVKVSLEISMLDMFACLYFPFDPTKVSSAQDSCFSTLGTCAVQLCCWF